MSTETESKVCGILEAASVSFTITLAAQGLKRDGWECDEWAIMFARGNESEIFNYYTGIGHRKAVNGQKCPYPNPRCIAAVEWAKQFVKPVKPEIAGVIYSLLMDSEASDMSFSSWCDNSGYDSDSLKALNTYQECEQNAKKFFKIFPRAVCEELWEALQDY